MGYTTLFSTLTNLKGIAAAAQFNSSVTDCNEYKALICFSMSGGNDSFNLLTPFKDANESNTQYDVYSGIRTDLALDLADLTEINVNNPLNERLAIPNYINGMKNMYDSGDLAFLANIGSLVVPITDSSHYYTDVEKPLGLYSHSDQQMHWQTANPAVRSATGWGGLMADMSNQSACNTAVSINISLNGTNIYQTGNEAFSYVISPWDGSIGLRNYGQGNSFYNLRDAGMNNIMDHDYQDAFKNAYKDKIKDSNDTHLLFSSSIDSVSLTQTFGDSRVEKSFEMIAKTIIAANSPTALNNMKRQIFFVDMGGFDVHDEVLVSQEDSFTEINAALETFKAEMEQANLHDSVTTFSISEFGRTLTSNGQGSDHGWGGNQFIMGGSVNGNMVYGTYPELDFNSSLEIGGGVYIPTMSADMYFAELALWFGVPKLDLPMLFPNIGEFYDIYSNDNPLGLLS